MIEELSLKVRNEQGISIVTNYRDAVGWLHNDFVMCNKLPEIDNSIYDNARFSFNEVDDNGEETGEFNEIFQWFITNTSEEGVEYLEKRFGLLFTYSDLLDCYVLCVSHYGTSWDYVFNSDSEMDETAKKALQALEGK